MDTNAIAGSNASTGTARAGKSGQSVGHQAKAAVEAARADGVEMPRSAQGMAASAIAKGAEPGSVFAAMAVTEIPDAEDLEAATSEEPPAQATPSFAQAGYGEAAGIVATAGRDEAEIALDLLAGQGI